MSYENAISKMIEEYLENGGYKWSKEDVEELTSIYLDCQIWYGDELKTGATIVEVMDWIRHTSEVDRITSKYYLLNQKINNKDNKLESINADTEDLCRTSRDIQSIEIDTACCMI